MRSKRIPGPLSRIGISIHKVDAPHDVCNVVWELPAGMTITLTQLGGAGRRP